MKTAQIRKILDRVLDNSVCKVIVQKNYITQEDELIIQELVGKSGGEKFEGEKYIVINSKGVAHFDGVFINTYPFDWY